MRDDLARLRDLIDRLARHADPPTLPTLLEATAAAGFAPDEVFAHAGRGEAGVALVVAELAGPDDEPYHDGLVDDAERIAAEWADGLGLPGVDALAGWPHRPYERPHRRRAGHWVVSVAVGAGDEELPVGVEVRVAYGAGLARHLAELAPPPAAAGEIDWAGVSARLGVEPPADYRWLVEAYGTAAIGGRVTLVQPGALEIGDVLAVADLGDGGVVAYEPEPQYSPLPWTVVVRRVGERDRDTSVGLLHLLVAVLSGNCEI